MKLTKFFIMFYILTISFIACKVSKLEVTEPGFPKNYGNYSYVGNYGGIVGAYVYGTNYKLVIEGLGNADLNAEQKNAIDKIYNIVGGNNVGNVLNSLKDLDINNLDDKTALDKVIQNANISETQKSEITNIIYGNGNTNIFNGIKFNTNN